MSRRRSRERWWNKRITLTWWGEIAIALACFWREKQPERDPLDVWQWADVPAAQREEYEMVLESTSGSRRFAEA